MHMTVLLYYATYTQTYNIMYKYIKVKYILLLLYYIYICISMHAYIIKSSMS